MVGHLTLDQAALVRIQAPQPNIYWWSFDFSSLSISLVGTNRMPPNLIVRIMPASIHRYSVERGRLSRLAASWTETKSSVKTVMLLSLMTGQLYHSPEMACQVPDGTDFGQCWMEERR